MSKTRTILLPCFGKIKSRAPEFAVLSPQEKRVFFFHPEIFDVYTKTLRNWAQSASLLIVNYVHNKKLYFYKTFLISDLSLYIVCLNFWLDFFHDLARNNGKKIQRKGKVIGKLWRKKRNFEQIYLCNSAAVLAGWWLHQSRSLFFFK